MPDSPDMGLGRIVGLLAVAMSLGVGQLLFKRAAERLVIDQDLGVLMVSFVSRPMLAALALYGVATVAWVYLLHGLALSRAYPFIALAFALVPILSWLVLGETIGARYWLGLALVLAGLYFVVTSL